MDTLLISVFNADESAYAGLAALSELDRQGDIKLYSSTLVAKDMHGKTSILDDPDRAPRGMLAGAIGGGLVGLVGGPPGAAVGAFIGGLGGGLHDGVRDDEERNFVDEATSALEPGGAAIIAELDEDWLTPVDTRLGALGARSFRRPLGPRPNHHVPQETSIPAASRAS